VVALLLRIVFPIAIFLGRLQGAQLALALAIQSGWLLLAWAAARAMWKCASAIIKLSVG
jgi:ABC-type uncharacterized transport system permease subunit